MANIIREYKRHYNKLDQVFECDRIHLDSSLAVLRYVTDREYRVAGQVTETGSTTLAVYEQGNRTVFWKMLRPDGSFQGYLVHLCEPIEIRPGSVSYRDLMLDVWMGQDGELELLDEDDLRDALAAGQISTEAAAAVLSEAHWVLSEFDRLVSRGEEVLSRYADLTPGPSPSERVAQVGSRRGVPAG